MLYVSQILNKKLNGFEKALKNSVSPGIRTQDART